VPNRKIPSAAPERARRWVGLDSQGQVIPPSHYVGARALRGEQVNGQDYRYYPEEGGERWLRLSGVPLYDHAEQLMGAAVVIIDVDAERRNEVMLRQFNHALEHEVDLRTQALQEALDRLTVEIQERNHAEELLRHSQKMEAVGQLTGGIAHDFNNMLTGIIGALDLIRMRLDAGRHDDLPRYLDAAHGSAQRAAALTQRLLAFSRRQSLQTRPTEVNALIRAMADLLQRSLSETTGFELELDEAAGLALADPNQLENALLNLTLNARDAMPGGGTLRIETSRLRIDAEQAAQHAVPADEYVRLRLSIRAPALPRDCSTRCSSPSSPPSRWARAPGSGYRWSMASFARAAASSTSTVSWARAPSLRCTCQRRRPMCAKCRPAVSRARRARGMGSRF